MGNVQATASHDDNTDNNDNYVEDDIDKKDNTGQLYPRNARFLSSNGAKNKNITLYQIVK